MNACGIFVINPPYILPTIYKNIIPTLIKILSQDNSSYYKLKYNIL